MKDLEENVENVVEENCQVDNNDEEGQHPKDNLIDPHMKCDNMTDLKFLDFNSADDVRQSLKVVFTRNVPNLIEHSEDYVGLTKECGNVLLKDNPQQNPVLVLKTDNNNFKNNNKRYNVLKLKRSTDLRSSKNRNIPKRRGRPPKAGPSKTIKKRNINTLFFGKLSNIVFIKRGIEIDSDIDSSSSSSL